MTQLSSRLYPNPLITLNAASLTGSYQVIGTPLPNPTRIIKFTNDSDTAVTISWDGVNDHEALAAGEFLLLDVSSNREITTNVLEIAQGLQFYVNGTAGTGNIYISSYYAY